MNSAKRGNEERYYSSRDNLIVPYDPYTLSIWAEKICIQPATIGKKKIDSHNLDLKP